MTKKKKPKSKIVRAGQLLSQFIKSIALEETELVKGADGEDRMATKAEALARLTWKKALGYTETQKDAEGKLVDIVHIPDKTMMAVLWDRMEGRAPLMSPDKKGGRTIADRVSEQNKKRTNKIARSSLKN